MNARKFGVAAGAAALLVTAFAGTSLAGATKGGAAKLACIVQGPDGSNPTACVVSAGTAVIQLTDPASGALVYQTTNAVASARLADLTALNFSYSGGLAPRLNLPVDQSAYDSGVYDYVFIEGGTCNDGHGNVKPLSNPVCSVQYVHDVTGTGTPSATYPSWAAFLTANPTVALVDNNSNQPYVIQDTPGSGSISNVQLGKPMISGPKNK